MKNINSASSNKHLKIGEKREKRGYFVTSNGHHRRRGDGGAENFFGNSTFYALQHPQIWSNSERSLHKSVTKVKILLYILFPDFPQFSRIFPPELRFEFLIEFYIDYNGLKSIFIHFHLSVVGKTHNTKNCVKTVYEIKKELAAFIIIFIYVKKAIIIFQNAIFHLKLY